MAEAYAEGGPGAAGERPTSPDAPFRMPPWRWPIRSIERLRSRRLPEASAIPMAEADCLWLLGAVTQVLQIPFDAVLVRREFPPPHTFASFRHGASRLGIRIGSLRLDPSGFEGVPVPFIARLAHPCADPGADGGGGGTAPSSWLLVVRADRERVLFFRGGSEVAEVAPADDFLRRIAPVVHPAARARIADAEVDADAPGAPAFGLSWFLPELLRHRRVWSEVLVASLLIQAAGLAVPLFTQVIVDKVIVHQTHATLWVVATGIGMFSLFGVLMAWARQYLVAHTGTRIDAVLGARVFAHLLRLPLPWFEARPTGTIVNRLHGVETLREFLCGSAMTLLLDIPFVLLFLAVMFWYAWQLALVVVAVLALIAVLSASFAGPLRRRTDRLFLLGARNQAFVTEHVAAIATVKSLQAEPRTARRFEGFLAEYLEQGFRIRMLGNHYTAGVGLLEQAMTLAVLVAGALLVMERTGFTVGMLVAFQMFASRLTQPVLRLAGLWQEAQQAAVALHRLRDLMDCPPEPHALTPRHTRDGLGRVEFRQVGFRYGPRRPWVFRGLDLVLERGELILLTGRSGAGKSTLARLLLRFGVPDEGCIVVDGQDTAGLAANELRGYFGVVPQETQLFSGTIADNVAAADPSATFDDIVKACRAAEVHGFVESLPDGYDTRLGERGIGLSGGQRQRIAIARALLKRARVLIFDEATSALDEETAAQLVATIDRLRAQVAILFIAHRVPPGLHPSRTLCLDALARA